MKIISLVNEKGGVGKTTTAVNLSDYLVQLGKKVLLIDYDPQANSTICFGFNTTEMVKSAYEFLIDGTNIKECIQIHNGIHILPSNKKLAGGEMQLAVIPDGDFLLSERLKRSSKDLDYDYIFIDCPPGTRKLTNSALQASNETYLITQSEYLSQVGITQMINLIKVITDKLNANLKIGGILLTMVDNRLILSNKTKNELNKSNLNNLLFKTFIRRNTDLGMSFAYAKTIREYAPNSNGAKDYFNLAKELVENG